MNDENATKGLVPPSIALPWRLVAALGSIVALGPAAINGYLPALPTVQEAFGAARADAQFTLAFPMLVFAVALVMCGPLSDRYGRRPLLLAGMVLFVIGSVLGFCSPSMLVLVVGRAVQSIGAAIGLIVARALVTDTYTGARATRMVTVFNVAAILGHAAAAPLGGLAVMHVGWRSIFAALAVIGALCAAVLWRWLPQAHMAAPFRPVPRRPSWEGSGALLSAPFITTVVQVAGLYASFSVFAAVGPYVMLATYDGTPAQYGQYYAMLPAAFLAGSGVVLRQRESPRRIVAIGYIVATLAAMLGLALTLCEVLHPLALFVPMAGVCFGQAIVLPAISVRAVSTLAAHAGTAWGLLTFTQHFTSAIAVQAASTLPTSSALPIQIVCVVTVIAMALVYKLSPV